MANSKHIPKSMTEDGVKDIRLNYVPRKKGFTVRDFAVKYHVSTTTVNQILKGVTWAHVVVVKPEPAAVPAAEPVVAQA